MSTAHSQHITADDIGKTVRLSVKVYDLDTGRSRTKIDRYLIVSVEPAGRSYYRTCPDAGPRVQCALRRIMSTGKPSPMLYPHWLPTVGNVETVEVES